MGSPSKYTPPGCSPGHAAPLAVISPWPFADAMDRLEGKPAIEPIAERVAAGENRLAVEVDLPAPPRAIAAALRSRRVPTIRWARPTRLLGLALASSLAAAPGRRIEFVDELLRQLSLRIASRLAGLTIPDRLRSLPSSFPGLGFDLDPSISVHLHRTTAHVLANL